MIHELPNGYIAVKVPKDADNFQLMTPGGDVDFWKGTPRDTYSLYANGILNTPLVHLHLKDRHEIVGKADGLVLTDIISIVESEHDGSNTLKRWYKNYLKPDAWIKGDPSQSFASLLKSLSLDPETTLILKKIKE